MLAREEIFGPVLVAMTFRTPGRGGRARQQHPLRPGRQRLEREHQPRARCRGPRSRPAWCGSIPPTCSTPPSGFGGYRESGFGREGGREGLYEYRVADEPRGKPKSARPPPPRRFARPQSGAETAPAAARTAPPSSSSAASRRGPIAATATRFSIPQGARSAWRGAATARTSATRSKRRPRPPRGARRRRIIARKCSTTSPKIWPRGRSEFARRLSAMTGASDRAARAEVEASIRRAFVYAAWADKYDGAVHATPSRFVTLAMNEPWGVMGIVCPDEAPLLAFVSLVMPAIAMGNCVVAIPSASHPLSATDFYQVLETSDVPAGVVNIVTGEPTRLRRRSPSTTTSTRSGTSATPRARRRSRRFPPAISRRPGPSAGAIDWAKAEGREFLRRATQVKNIWTPYGE